MLFKFLLKKYSLALLLSVALFALPFNCFLPFVSAQTWVWGREGVGAYMEGCQTATDATGNVFFGGYNYGSLPVTFGSITVPPSSSFYQAVWAKYNSVGTALWAGGVVSGNAWLYNLTTDPSGNLIVLGAFNSPALQIGSFTLTNTYGGSGAAQYYLAKIGTTGAVMWAVNDGNVVSADAISLFGFAVLTAGNVTTDAAGNIYIVSSFIKASTTIGPYTLTNADPSGTTCDIFVAEYNPTGSVLWASSIGGNANDYGFGITLGSGNVYIAGSFFSPSISVGYSVISDPHSNPLAYIAKFSDAGIPLWAQSAGGANGAYAIALTSDNSGNVYMTGSFGDAAITFGSTTVTRTYPAAVPQFAQYLVQYSPSDVVTWSKTIGSPTKTVYGYSIALAPCGQVWTESSYDENAVIDAGDTLALVPGSDGVFIAGYNLSGSVAGYSGLGGGGDDQNGIASDGVGNIYLCSDFEGTSFSVGSDVLTASGGAENFYMAKYAPASFIPDTVYTTIDTTNCTGITLTAPAGYSVYYWDNGATTLSRGVSASGKYYVLCISCGSPVLIDTFNFVMIPSLPDAGVITGPGNVCAGSSILLSDTATGGIWSCSNVTAVVSGGTVTGVSAGIDTIIYTVTKTCGTSIATTTVTINPLPDPGAITGPSSVCVGATSSLSDAATGGAWNTANLDASVSGGLVTGMSVGIDTISYFVSNSCGIAFVTHTLTVLALPDAGTISGLSTVCVGATITLADPADGGAGTWNSSNANAGVVAGVVTGMVAGTSIISYSVSNTCGTATATFVVAMSSFVPTTAPITGPVAAICAGTSTTLSEPTTGGVWGSSNKSAYVTGGVVTAASGGVDTISYSITNGCGSASSVYVVTINPLPAVGNILGLDNACPGYTVTLADGVGDGTWSSSDNGIATVTDGVVRGVSAGTAFIIYTTTNACGTSSIKYPFTVLGPSDCVVYTGVATPPGLPEGEEVLRVYPNPNGGEFTVNLLSAAADEAAGVVVMNMVGQKVKEFTMMSNKPSEVQLNVPAGVYFISVSTASGRYVQKVVVDRLN